MRSSRYVKEGLFTTFNAKTVFRHSFSFFLFSQSSFLKIIYTN